MLSAWGGMSLPPETQVDKRYPIEAGDKWAQGRYLQLVSCVHFLRKEQVGSGLDIYNQPPLFALRNKQQNRSNSQALSLEDT